MASRFKELPVRTNSVGEVENELRPKAEKGPELSELLNEETKKKYVKGRFTGALNLLARFLMICRQKAW